MLVFAFFISACAAANQSKSKSYDFAAIWLMLLAIGHAVGGTLMLRKVRVRACMHVRVCVLLQWVLLGACSPRCGPR